MHGLVFVGLPLFLSFSTNCYNLHPSTAPSLASHLNIWKSLMMISVPLG